MAGSSVIGLDIGSQQIKAVHVERRRREWSILSAGIVPTPPDAVQDGVILSPPLVAEAVRQLLRDARMPPVDTIAAVSGTHVLVRSIRVPDMNAAALKRSIRFEAAKHVDQGSTGISIDNCAVEYEVRGKVGTPPQLDVLLVVAPQPMVTGRVSVIEGAGLEAVAVDVEAFALLRALDAAGWLPGENQAVVVCDMGATYTDVNIVVGNQVAVTRSIPIGGNSLTATLASVLNVPAEEAEEHKRFMEVGGDEANHAAAVGMETPNMARQVVVPFLDELIRELRRSVIYFQSQAAEAGMSVAVEQVVLAGGGAQLAGLAEYLQDRLGMEIRCLDPLAMHPDSAAAVQWQGHGAEFAVATGLALKEYV